jgi:hypothetical protein
MIPKYLVLIDSTTLQVSKSHITITTKEEDMQTLFFEWFKESFEYITDRRKGNYKKDFTVCFKKDGEWHLLSLYNAIISNLDKLSLYTPDYGIVFKQNSEPLIATINYEHLRIIYDGAEKKEFLVAIRKDRITDILNE